jgi:hydrogenase-4 component E
MVQILDPLLIVVLALNFVALGVTQISGVIRAAAIQGMVLGLCPLLVHPEIELRNVLLAAVMIGLKGFVLPGLLVHALREVRIQHEVQPLVPPMSSLLLGAVGTALALIFARRLPLVDFHTDTLLVPASLATVWTGSLLLTTRRKAILQVVGYLLLENGIFLFSLLLLEAVPFLVEVGVLLDLLTGVFVMGIIIHHISREFASISTDHLMQLKG